MLITNDFEVAKPVAAVWDFFGDIPRVALLPAWRRADREPGR